MIAALALIVAMLPGTAAFARQAGPPSVQTGVKAADGLSLGNRQLAEGLADRARNTGDARIMIVAARVLGTMPDPADKRALTRSAALAEARFLAKGDPELLDEIAEEAAAEAKGVACPCGGTQLSGRHVVPAGQSLTLTLNGTGGTPLIVAAKPERPGLLALVLLDENGGQICRDSGDAIVACRFTPIWTGPLTVRIDNRDDGDLPVAVASRP